MSARQSPVKKAQGAHSAVAVEAATAEAVDAVTLAVAVVADGATKTEFVSFD
jgi:hypothetical protein